MYTINLYWKYYNYLDSLDLSSLKPIKIETIYSEVKKNGKTYQQPINHRTLEQKTVERKVNLWYNLCNNNWYRAELDLIWFEQKYGINFYEATKND